MADNFRVIGNPDDAADADFIVVQRLTQPLLMPDNLIDTCNACGEAVQHRPHNPKGVPMICHVCIGPLLNSDVEELLITPQTADDLIEFIRKRKQN